MYTQQRRAGWRLRMGQSALVVCAVSMISACAAPDGPRAGPRAVSLDNQAQVAVDHAAMDRAVYIDLIRSMLDQRQYYAALAHVEQQRAASGNDNDELLYYEAEARRGLGQVREATVLYQKLLKTALAGQAYHGLGKLYGGVNATRATEYLQQAAKRLPTDATVRNDYGYALMRAGRLREAMLELSTAVELAPDAMRARNNLLQLMMLQGNEAAVQQIIREAAVPPATVTRLRQQVQAMRAPQRAPGGVQ